MDYEDLDSIFIWQEVRPLSASLTLQHDKVLYLVTPSRENQRLAGKRVMVIDYPDGRIKLRHEGRDLPTDKRSVKCPTRRYPSPAERT